MGLDTHRGVQLRLGRGRRGPETEGNLPFKGIINIGGKGGQKEAKLALHGNDWYIIGTASPGAVEAKSAK